MAETKMDLDDPNEQIVEFDPSCSAWHFKVELPLDGNTHVTFEGYRLTRADAREAVMQARSLGVRRLYLDSQHKRPF